MSRNIRAAAEPEVVRTPGPWVLYGSMVNLTESLCALPGVPTVDWLNRAAAKLVCSVIPSATVVALVSLDKRGVVGEIFALGLAGRTPLVESSGKRGHASDAAGTLHEWRCLSESLIGAHWSPSAMQTALPWGVITEHAHWKDGQQAPFWRALGTPSILSGAAWVDEVRGHAAIIHRAIAQVPFWPEHPDTMSASAVLVARLLRRVFGSGSYDTSKWLTPAEAQVLDELIRGKSERQIALDLSRSPHTIHDYVKSLHQKLGARTRGALIARAVGLAGGLGVPDQERIREIKRNPQTITR